MSTERVPTALLEYPGHIGFTGTRSAVTEIQRAALAILVEDFKAKNWLTFHHGDCVGADALAHQVAQRFGLYIVVHPPSDPKHRAFCGDDGTGLTAILPEKDYLTRNRDIVEQSSFLIALPDGPMRLRSGTWATVRYARALGRSGVVIYPDGLVEGLAELSS